MNDDKPICGACEHWRMMHTSSVYGYCFEVIPDLRIRAFNSEPQFKESLWTKPCFKLWEEK